MPLHIKKISSYTRNGCRIQLLCVLSPAGLYYQLQRDRRIVISTKRYDIIVKHFIRMCENDLYIQSTQFTLNDSLFF